MRLWAWVAVLVVLGGCSSQDLAPLQALQASRQAVVSPEIRVGDPVSDIAGGAHLYPAIAFDGVNFLQVWEDSRSLTSADIYGVRISPDGQFRDPFGLPIAIGPESDLEPSLAWNGSMYLVAWAQSNGTDFDIRAQRIGQDGLAIGGTVTVSASVGDQRHPVVASDGTDFLVVWEDRRTDALNPDIYGARVSAAGQVLDATGLALSTAVRSQFDPAISFNGTDYYAVWSDFRSNLALQIFGARISTAGALLDATGVKLSSASGDASDPSVACTGGICLAAWAEAVAAQQDVRAMRVSAAGALLDGAPLAIATGTGIERNPSVAIDGVNFRVAYADTANAVIRVVLAAGTLSSPISYAIGNENELALGVGAGRELVTISGSGDLASIGVNLSSGALVWQKQTAVGSNEQTQVAIAGNATTYLLTWADTRGTLGYNSIYGARVSPSGTLLDPQGFGILNSGYFTDSPAVASNGSEFLVAWHSNLDIRAARVGNDGQLLGSFFASAGGAYRYQPAVASNGADYLVVWEDRRNGANERDIYATRVTSTGSVLDTSGIPVCTVVGAQGFPTVGFDGVDYLVAWEDERACTGCFRIYAAHITATGQVLEPNGFQVSSASRAVSVSAASSPGQALLVWRDQRLGTMDVFGARFAPDAGQLDPTGIALYDGPSDQRSPTATFDGDRYVVTWEDSRGSSADVYGTRLSTAGILLEPPGDTTASFLVSNAARNENAPSIASDGQGHLLIAYSRFESDLPLSSHRVFARTEGQPLPNGAVCSTSLDCVSAFCVDAVCCESACSGQCEACSVGAGAAVDGVCSALPAENGSCVEQSIEPQFQSAPPSGASCSAPYLYSPVVSGAAALSFQVRGVDGGSLPARVFVSPQSGEVFWRPDETQVGPQSFELVATGSTGTAVQRIEVEVSCKDGGLLGVNCDCNQTGGVPFVALMVLGSVSLFRRRAKQR